MTASAGAGALTEPGTAVATIRKVASSWNELTTAQKVVAVLAVAALTLGGYAFATWLQNPSLVPLYTGLDPADGAAIVDELQATGVPYRLADGGATVLVPAEQVYELRLDMSAAGLPGSSATGYSLLDEQGVTASQFQQEVAYQRAVEGELARTISALDGVDAAVVHLAIPQQDVFLDVEETPTASVLLDTAGTTRLGNDEVSAVVHLVSSSVDGMTADDVTVVDADGALLSAAGSGRAGGGGVSDETADFEAQLTADLQALLDTVLGRGNAVATVAADLDLDAREATTETFVGNDDTPSLSESTTSERYVGSAPGEAGVLGPDNIVVPNEAAAGEDTEYSTESRTVNNAVGKITERTVAAPGAIERLSVSVVVDNADAGAVDLAALEQTIAAAAGLDAARGDTISVTRLDFDVTAAEEAAAELEAARDANAGSWLRELLRTAVLGVLVLLTMIVLLVVFRRRKPRVEVLDVNALPVGALPAAEPALPETPQLELTIPPAPIGPTPEELAEAREIESRRVDVIDLVERQPAEVAELLRGWLADRRN